MTPSKLLATVLLGLGVVSAQKGGKACNQSFCLTVKIEDDRIIYAMSTTRTDVGWMGVGFGQQMADTHMVMMWNSTSSTTTTLSQRFGFGLSEPMLVPRPPIRAETVVDINTMKSMMNLDPTLATLAFWLPYNHNATHRTEHRLIYALSNYPVSGSNPDAHLSHHVERGHLTLDLSKDFSEISSPTPKATTTTTTMNGSTASLAKSTAAAGSDKPYTRVERLIMLHGLLVSFGFLILLPAGALIGRYGRAFTNKWFKYHWMTNLGIAGPVITTGALLGPVIVYNKDRYRTHFINAHEICGVLLLLAYWLQVLLGRFIHARRLERLKLGPITDNHPPCNIFHIFLGVTIVTLAFFQIRSGLEWWETLTGRGPIVPWVYTAWTVWIVVFPMIYFGGYALLPRQLRSERDPTYAPLHAADSVDAQQSTRLLADEES